MGLGGFIMWVYMVFIEILWVYMGFICGFMGVYMGLCEFHRDILGLYGFIWVYMVPRFPYSHVPIFPCSRVPRSP
jgi:hypothetical protein